MSTFKVDKEQVDNSVETLRKLLEECEEAYTKEIPESTVDKGQTHNELSDLCNNIKTTCYYLGELINNTILFLGKSSEMFEISDKESAAAIMTTENSSRFFEEGIKYKISEYREILNSNATSKEKLDAAIKWLSGISKDASKYKQYAEWIVNSDSDLEYPSVIKTGLDFIKAIDASNKLVSGSINYTSGLISEDVNNMTTGAKEIISSISNSAGFSLKTNNKLFNFKADLLLKYGKNMVSNWLDSIQNETEVSEVYWNTFVNSTVDVFGDTVCNTPTLAIAYLPAKWISDKAGFDLQGAYEKTSDEKGFAAVTDTFEQLGDIFKENSSWENWKSGMGVICDEVKGWFKSWFN